MARAGPVFGEPKVGEDWVVTPFWIVGDEPRALRVYVNPLHEASRDVEITTTLWRWDGLSSGTLLNLRIDSVYDDPDEVVTSSLQVWTPRNGTAPIGPVHGLRATATSAEVVLEWDTVDSRATQLEIRRHDGVGGTTMPVTGFGPGSSRHSDVEPLTEYHYTVRSVAAGGEAAATFSIRTPVAEASAAAARWQPTPVNIGFGASAQPAVTSRAPGVVDLFYFDGQTKVLHQLEISEMGITNETLPVQTLNAPKASISASALSPFHLDLVWGFEDGRHAWLDDHEWHEESPFDIPPGAASSGNHETERMDYFWALGGTVQHKWWQPEVGWHPVESVGGSIGGSRIAAAGFGPDRIDIFHSSPSNALIHRTYDPTREWWSDEQTLGQLKAPIGGLAAACAPPDLNVFYVRADGRVAYRALQPDDTWGEELAVPGIDVEVASLAATAWQPYHFDVVYANAHGIMWRTWLSA